ncbi:hypothetical protein ACHQM5_014027 [Ranunculus cassubicifolius]
MELKRSNQRSDVDNNGGGGGVRSKRSVVNGGGGDSSHRKSTEPIDDHWEFLEEIDAPKWVDLAIESMSTDDDINANWFEVAHPFHQLSSYHFLSEAKVNQEAGPSSPGLPTSVSKSRGKHYKSRKWKGDNRCVTMGKKHPIKSFGAKSSSVASSSCQEIKSKTKTTCGSLKGTVASENKVTDATRPISFQRKSNPGNRKIMSNLSSSLAGQSSSSTSVNQKTVRLESSSSKEPNPLKHKLSFVESRTTQTITSTDSQPKFQSGNSESISTTNASATGSSNSASYNMSDCLKSKLSFGSLKSSSKSKESIGSESNPPNPHRVSDLCHQTFGQTDGLLLAVRASLRKSHVTRQPARVEVKDMRESKDRKSYSSKSSMGSTTNSGCNLKNTLLTAAVNKTKTPESRPVTEVDQPIDHINVEVKNVAKTCSGRQFQAGKFNSKLGGKAVARRSASQEISKSKVPQQLEGRKPLRLRNVQNSSVDGPTVKAHVTNINNGNPIGRNIVRRNTASKENDVGSMLWLRKAPKHSATGRDKEVLDPKGNVNARSNKLKNTKTVAVRAFR